MEIEERIAAIVQRAKDHDRIANSGVTGCQACDWREAYCLMDIAWRAQGKLRDAERSRCTAQCVPDLGMDLCDGCQKRDSLRAEAEKIIGGILDGD